MPLRTSVPLPVFDKLHAGAADRSGVCDLQAPVSNVMAFVLNAPSPGTSWMFRPMVWLVPLWLSTSPESSMALPCRL